MKVTTEQKLATFVGKVPPDADALVLNHNGTTVQRWTLEQARLPACAAEVLEAGQSHVEDLEAAARFDLEWRDKLGKVLMSKLVLCEPPPEDDLLGSVSIGGSASLGQGLALSYKHQHTQMKMLVGMLGPLFAGYKDLLEGYRHENDVLRTRMLGLSPELGASLVKSTVAGEDPEVTRLKIAAFEKLIELGPDVGRLGLAALARAAGLQMPEDETEAAKAGANGRDPH